MINKVEKEEISYLLFFFSSAFKSKMSKNVKIYDSFRFFVPFQVDISVDSLTFNNNVQILFLNFLHFGSPLIIHIIEILLVFFKSYLGLPFSKYINCLDIEGDETKNSFYSMYLCIHMRANATCMENRLLIEKEEI